MPLRRELLLHPREDGGVDVLDLVLERVVALAPEEARALDAPDAALAAKLQSLVLLEGAVADSLREAAGAGRAAADWVAELDWELARSLPSPIATAWREPERMRRLAQERAAGRRYLRLDGFIEPEAAHALADAAAALAYDRMDSPVVHAERH